MSELPDDLRALITRARVEQPRAPRAMRARVKLAVERLVAAPPVAPPPPRILPWKLGKLATPAFVAMSGVTAVSLLLFAPREAPLVEPAPPVHVAPEEEEAPTAPEPPPAPVRELPPARDRSDHLAEELTLIERADHAIRQGDVTTALRLLRLHRRDFRRGQLTRERQGLLLIAECMAKHAGTETRARLALATPSLLNVRIAEACGVEEP